MRNGVPSAATGVYVGLDIGGTKTAALVVDGNLQRLARLRAATDVSDNRRLVKKTVSLVHKALAEAQVGSGAICGLGIGVPGQVNRETGEVKLAVNLNLETFPLAKAMQKAFSVPTIVENDVRLAAVGVHQWLSRQATVQHMAYLSIGTGISAGLILNGRLYRGAHGMAGEIGHTIVTKNGPRCSCGGHGCLEAMAAGPAIARQYNDRLPPPLEVTAADVYAAAAKGDPDARDVIHQVSHTLARAIHWLLMTYDVEKVVIGGGVAKAGQGFLTPIEAALAQLRTQSNLAAEMLSPNKVMLLPSDFNAGTWGAVQMAAAAVSR